MQFKIIYRNRNGTTSVKSGSVENESEVIKLCDELSGQGKKILAVIS